MNIIFDFDGTIADSFDYILDFLSREAKREAPSGKSRNGFRGKSMKNMALELGVPYWRLPFLYFKGRRVMRAHMDDLQAFSGMKDVIKKFDSDGHQLYIISSNSSRNIKRFLIKNDLTGYFQAVWGGAGLFGKDNLIRSLRARYKLNDTIWYIGDETTDIRAARVAKINIVAVSWGFASREELAAKNPDLLVNKPSEILKIGMK